MLFAFINLLPILSKADGNVSTCSNFTSNCEQCLGLGHDLKCGWCKQTNQCMEGSESGPTSGSCAIWYYKFDMTCHLESAEPLPMGARIGIAVFSSIVAVVTAVYWICVFPHCNKPKKNEQEENQDNED